MKRFLPLLILSLLIFKVYPQVFHSDYQDGSIYLKLSKAALKPVSMADPMNIPFTQLGILSKTLVKYGAQRIARPFHQAWEDEELSYILKVSFTQWNKIGALIEEVSSLPGVVYAEKVPLMKTHITPNDPQYTGAVHLTQIGAPNAWNVFNGNSNIKVAIVDNAVMWNHADLVQNIYVNPGEIAANGIDDDNNGYVDDVNGWDAADIDNDPLPPNNTIDHGTHCAGIAGARTDNATGVASIGWNLKIIPVKGEPSGSGSVINVTNGYEGIIYAVKAGARIISCSFGNSTASATEQSVITYAWNRGAILFASAGNNNNSAPNYPGAYANAFCVAAVAPNDVKSNLSSYGSWVDISAPGDNIISTVPYTGTPNYQPKTGTSMATPMVAGLAGLMLSKSPNMTRADVLNCLSTTAVNINTLTGNAAYSGSLGAGRIDAAAAMSCAATFSAMPPVANFYGFPLNTCPNTAINFYDSSLYQPTSWAWTFQGGSPANSTLANPTVSWTTAGTYSVSLTVSNANGSNSKTKTGYVTVSGAMALPLTEGFQATQFLPANWTAKNIWNDPIYWTRVTGVGGFGTSTACAMFDNFNLNAPFERDEMRTPKYNLTNVNSAKLRFDVAYARYNATFSDSLEVLLSTDCGASWTSIYAKGGSTLATAPDAGSYFTPTATQWRTDSINISPLVAGQGNVMFAFANRGHYGQPIYLDNINLFFPAPILSTSFSPTACAGSSVTFTNMSAGAMSYTWTFQGGPPQSNFPSPSVTFITPGTFTVQLAGTNATSTTSITRTITIAAPPVLSLTTTPTTCDLCQGAVDAGSSGSAPFTYSLSIPGCSTLPCLNLCQGAYTLHTTDANGCAASKAFTIDCNTEVGELNPENISIYPNPASSEIKIRLHGSFGYMLYNQLGEVIAAGPGMSDSANIPTSEFANGIYTLLIRTAHSQTARRIIIEK